MPLRRFALAGIAGIAALAAAAGSVSCVREPAPDRLTIALPHEVTTLDPHATFTLPNLAVLLNVYETLVSSDSEMRLAPCLAQRWENPDLTTWVFHLRPNVRFHGGKVLDSGDVVYSFDRLLRRRDLKMSGYLLYIESVEAVGPLAVRIRTTRPLSVLLNKISYVAIVPRGSEDARLAAGEDGTGPYRLVRFRPDAIELARNDRYWGARPFAREVTIRLGVAPDKARRLIENGGANLVQCNSRALLPPAGRPDRYRVVRQPDVFVRHLQYDLQRDSTPGVPGGHNPFRDIRVRRAINLAVDRNELVAALPSPASPASQLVPPFIFGFDPAIALPQPDLAQAARLLSEAGYPQGFDVRLDVRRHWEPAARNVARQLARVKIRADVRVYSDREFSEMDERGASSFSLEAFGCTTGDMSDILDNVLHSSDASHHFGLYNSAGYTSPEVDRLIEESAGIADPVARRSLLQKIDNLVMDDLVLIPLYLDEDVFAVDRTLSWHPRNDAMVLAADIAPAARAAVAR